MEVQRFLVGPLNTNCYLVQSKKTKETLLVDPGMVCDELDDAVRELGAENLKYILLTHGHFDHIGGAAYYQRMTHGKIVMFYLESRFAADGALNLGKSFYSPVEPFQPDITLREADTLPFGGESITVLHTPGHTSGSCVYCLGNILFTGDTLMRFSIGRTDFPTGNLAEMRASLSRLAALEGEYLVYPGHVGPTTLQKERENNPYLGQSNYDDIY